jgi:hypothetical protein
MTTPNLHRSRTRSHCLGIAPSDRAVLAEHIEAVAIRAYNNAVVLMELGQYDLAER